MSFPLSHPQVLPSVDIQNDASTASWQVRLPLASKTALAEKMALLEELLWLVPGVLSITTAYYLNQLPHMAVPEAIVLLWAESIEPSEFIASVKALLDPAGLSSLVQWDQSPVLIEENDWQEAWKAYWKPQRILHNLVICPTWETLDDIETTDSDIILRLDPKTAFGTGRHESTQLMLYALDSFLTQRQGYARDRVLDVGTGSGVLAFYAACLGAKTLVGLDIDAEAIEVAKENLAPNQLPKAAQAIELEALTLDAWVENQKDNDTTFDVVLANILLDPILELLPVLTACTKHIGLLMLSGIVDKQFDALHQAIKALPQLEIKTVIQRGQWLCVVCQRHVEKRLWD